MNSYTHQNGKVEGEAVGTDTTEQVQGVDGGSTDIHRTLHNKQPATCKNKPHTPTTIPPEPHTPSESGRHQRGSRQNITNANETQTQHNIQTSPEKNIINKADKGSTIVIQDRDTYTQIGLDHLKDTTTYIYLNMDPSTTLTLVNSYTHQNGKVEGEAVGNLDRLLEWNTIHIGTDTTEQVHGVS